VRFLAATAAAWRPSALRVLFGIEAIDRFFFADLVAFLMLLFAA
jgi:hypothetical protein